MTEKSKATTGKTDQSSQANKVLIVDDHHLVRFGIRTLLESEPTLEVCGEAGDEISAMKLVREKSPDLAIVDISLDGGNGLDLIKRIKTKHPGVLIVVLSMHDEHLFAERALRAGALGYVSKQAPARTIIAAIHHVLEEKVFLSESMTDFLFKQLSHKKDDLSASPVESFSDRELEVFYRLGQGLTIHEIAADLHLSPKTVGTYRDRIRQKLELSNSAELNRQAFLWVMENS